MAAVPADAGDGSLGPVRDIARPLPRAAASCILGRIAPCGHVSCSFLALVLNKELEERMADLDRNGS